MSELIYVDESGNETKRVTKGRGRPPVGAVKQEDGPEKGNFIVSPVTDSATRFVPEYVTVDETGTEVAPRVAKGRGRPKPGYAKAEDGDFVGHWVKVASIVAQEATEVPTETVVETKVEVETPVSA